MRTRTGCTHPRVARVEILLAAFLTVGWMTGCASEEDAVRAAFQNYRRAVHATDRDALREIMATERLAALDSPDAESVLEFLAEVAPSNPEILTVDVEGARAKLTMHATFDGQEMQGTARLLRENERWKMLEESWQIDFTQSFEITSRLGSTSPAPLEAGIYVPAHDGDVTQLAFTPDGRYLVSIGYSDFYLRVWDLWDQELADEIQLQGRPKDMALTPNAKYIVVGDAKGKIALWPLDGGKLGPPERLPGVAQHLTQLAMNRDGTLLATTSWEAPVQLWDLERREKVKSLQNSTSHRGVDFAPNEPLLISGGHDNTFTIWNLEARLFGGRKRLKVPKVTEQSDVWCITVSPDGRYLATGHMDSSISIWDLARRKQLHNFYVRDASTHVALFSPDGAVLATGQQNGRVYFWDPSTGKRIADYAGHDGGVKSLAFNTAGQYVLATGGEDGQIIVYQ